MREHLSRVEPLWMEKCDLAADRNRREQRHVRSHGLHASVKKYWIKLQSGKCAYCERVLDSSGLEADLEHFRPKAQVEAWVTAPAGVIDVGGDASTGYYLLAYDPENFLVSCRPCNVLYKKSFFPTAHVRVLDSPMADALTREGAYLINPMDGRDPDPADLIRFEGPFARAVDGDAEMRARALTTIVLLQLNREELVRERNEIIAGLGGALELMSVHPDADIRDRATRIVEGYCRPNKAHSSCARAFCMLWADDPSAARRHYDFAALLRT